MMSNAADELRRLKAISRGEGRRILAIDPGTSESGWACLFNGEVSHIGVLRAKGEDLHARIRQMCQMVADKVSLMRHSIDTLAIEWQSIRPTDKRPDNIAVLLAICGAALAIPLPGEVKVLTPTPQRWKGSTSQDVFHKRMLSHYPQAGALLTHVPASLQHNATHALGLAAWAIKERLPWA